MNEAVIGRLRELSIGRGQECRISPSERAEAATDGSPEAGAAPAANPPNRDETWTPQQLLARGAGGGPTARRYRRASATSRAR